MGREPSSDTSCRKRKAQALPTRSVFSERDALRTQRRQANANAPLAYRVISVAKSKIQNGMSLISKFHPVNGGDGVDIGVVDAP
jgi:hypothetical protein